METSRTSIRISVGGEAPGARQGVSPRLQPKRQSVNLSNNSHLATPPLRPTTPQPQRPTVTLVTPTPAAPENNTSPRLTDSTHSQEGASHGRRSQLFSPLLREGVRLLKVPSEEKTPGPQK